MNLALDQISHDDQKLLVDILLKQQYALELVSSEINDIESGEKAICQDDYNRLLALYDLLRFSK
ncbi:antirepressor AbbA [Metabacillus sp. GX 13764]|uniref:antirepressor AbbA n=1 Tax=Metabacillus kandeliae TaxID=2900151 RepID=UPI001E31CE2B|nr:antirepressor AbbA [Metabacillus kandeliae]MCD7035472.1 antirepressor AbbA [Metabacillus kandeliae]